MPTDSPYKNPFISIALPVDLVPKLEALINNHEFAEFGIIGLRNVDPYPENPISIATLNDDPWLENDKAKDGNDLSNKEPSLMLDKSIDFHQDDARVSVIKGQLNAKRNFPALLRNFIEKKKRPLEELAKGCDVRPQTIIKWGKGEHLPGDTEKIFLIGRALGLSSKEHNRMLKAWTNDREIEVQLDYLATAVDYGELDKALDQFTSLLKISFEDG